MTAALIAPPRTRASIAARALAARKISAGLRPAPGAHGQLPAWWGPQHWAEVVVPAAIASGRASRHHPVDPHTAVRLARIFARHADIRTGRNCRLTNATAAAEAGCSGRTVQRFRRFMEDLGLMVVVVQGRSILTQHERLQAWRNGSAVRQIAAEVALVLPRDVAPLCTTRRRPVDGVTPPVGGFRGVGLSPGNGVLHEQRARRMSAPRPQPRRRPPPTTPTWARHQRLAHDLQQRISWLRQVSPRRLTSLHRFAAQRWTPRDVHRALDEVLRARGWSVPDHVEQPAAYLARLLRDVDEHDRPGALEEAQREELDRRAEWVRLTTFAGRECPHGHPAGDLPHPIDGHLACPYCRRTT